LKKTQDNFEDNLKSTVRNWSENKTSMDYVLIECFIGRRSMWKVTQQHASKTCTLHAQAKRRKHALHVVRSMPHLWVKVCSTDKQLHFITSHDLKCISLP